MIRDAAAGLDWEIWPGVEIPDAEALHFVRRLLSESMVNQIRALNEIKGALPKGIDEVFELIAPCWVDEEAAQHLAAVRYAEPGKRCAIINGSEAGFTCEQFLKRVHPFKDSDILKPSQTRDSKPGRPSLQGEPGDRDSIQLLGGHAPIGRGGARELLPKIRRALCHRLNLKSGGSDQATDILINKELKEFEEDSGRHLVDEYKFNALQLPILGQLADHYKRVTFVALIGQNVPDLPPGLQDRVRIIEPLLAYGDSVRHNEEYAFRKWQRRQVLLGL